MFSLENVERLSRIFTENTGSKNIRFDGVVVSILDFDSKYLCSILGEISFSLSQKLQCSFVSVFSLENKKRLSRIFTENTSSKVIRFDGVVVSIMDFDSKDPCSILGRTSHCHKNFSVVSSRFVFSKTCRTLVAKSQAKHKP